VKVCASVDLDNYREYRRLVDPDGALPDVSFYDAALPRFLDAFDRHGMRATFFVVGKDLEVGAHRRAIREVAERGHEVGNHSWSHPYNLRSLPRREKEQEIARAEQARADAVRRASSTATSCRSSTSAATSTTRPCFLRPSCGSSCSTGGSSCVTRTTSWGR
jgi:peptidoglycan/xylan/chitin deacetylase (PgdA/CDA1 family)